MPPRREPCQNRVKTRAQCSSGDALALVADASRRWPRRCRRVVERDLQGDGALAVADRVLHAGWRGSGRACRGRPRSRAARRRRRASLKRSRSLPAGDEPLDVPVDTPGRSTGCWRSCSRPASMREMSSSSVISRVTRSASASMVSQHQPLLVVGEPVPLAQQGGGEPLDRGQRRAQLVGDRGDQRGAGRARPGGVPRRRAWRR